MAIRIFGYQVIIDRVSVSMALSSERPEEPISDRLAEQVRREGQFLYQMYPQR